MDETEIDLVVEMRSIMLYVEYTELQQENTRTTHVGCQYHCSWGPVLGQLATIDGTVNSKRNQPILKENVRTRQQPREEKRFYQRTISFVEMANLQS